MENIINIIPSERAAMAEKYFSDGYNCAQAVLLAFHDICGLDEKSAARMASSFGGGMGRMREVCGAVSGALIAVGIILGYDDPKNMDLKNEHYALVRRIADEFRRENGSIICRELLSGVEHTDGGDAEKRTSEYYKKRPCKELCGVSARIVAEALVEKSRE